MRAFGVRLRVTRFIGKPMQAVGVDRVLCAQLGRRHVAGQPLAARLDVRARSGARARPTTSREKMQGPSSPRNRGSFAVTGAFNGTYTSAVYEESGGTLDFYLQACRSTRRRPMALCSSASRISRERLLTWDIAQTAASAGQRPLCRWIPDPVDACHEVRSGDPVAWDFTGPDAINSMQPGDTSMVLEVKTERDRRLHAPATVELHQRCATTIDEFGVFAPVVTPMSSSANPDLPHRPAPRCRTAPRWRPRSTLDGSGIDHAATSTRRATPPAPPRRSTPRRSPTSRADGPWQHDHRICGHGRPAPTSWVASFSGDSWIQCLGKPRPAATSRSWSPSPPECARSRRRRRHAAQFAGDTASTLSRRLLLGGAREDQCGGTVAVHVLDQR